MNSKLQIKYRIACTQKYSIHTGELFWLGFCIIEREYNVYNTMMKRFSVSTALLCLVVVTSAFMISGIAADDIKGTYWDAEKKSHIRIYKAKNGKYYGKLDMLTEPNDVNGNPKKDPYNPDPSLRDRTCLGMVIAQAFSWDADENEWNGGTIYNPQDGKTYDAYLYFEGENKNKLYLRGYVMGMPFLGKTSEWTRIK